MSEILLILLLTLFTQTEKKNKMLKTDLHNLNM